MTDLSLVSMDDLITEIESRCTTFISAYETFSDKDKNIMITRNGKGNWGDSIKLATMLNNDCLNNWQGELRTLQRINDEEQGDECG